MRIESFWAKGYRSLRDVRIDGLGRFNVFYGPNGSGKSNLLEAIRTLFMLARAWAVHGADRAAPSSQAALKALQEHLVTSRDLCARAESREMVLGARLAGMAGIGGSWIDLPELTLEVTFEWGIRPTLSMSVLRSQADNFLERWAEPAHIGHEVVEDPKRPAAEVRDFLRELLATRLPARAYGLVGAERSPRSEKNTPTSSTDVVATHLLEGRLKNAFLAARVSPNSDTRRRLSALRDLLVGPPLFRPPFDPVQDPQTGDVDLREPLPEPNPEGKDISIDLAGLGIAQVYAILAKAMLVGADVIGIEEPEAHLHAPTTGRHLRQLLVRLVEEHHIEQLFIATHSNLFDLDPAGYFDVSLENGCTVVKRAELQRIDRDHLYEPGPAKHALQRMLQYAPPEEVVFRRTDGSPVTATEMLVLLQEDDAVAVDFLKDVHGAAVRAVKVRSARAEKQGS